MYPSSVYGRYSNSELVLISTLKISEYHRHILQNHAQRYNPNESCAVLYGRINDNSATVEDIFLADNADESPISFSIPSKQLIDAYKKAEDNSTGVIGIFHSHPSSKARPSDTDRLFMEINPVIWVIYSASDTEFRAFVLEDGVREIEIFD